LHVGRRYVSVAYEIIRIDGPVVYAKLSGVMKLADQRALQQTALGLLKQGIQVRLHLHLHDFHGWEKGVDWGDLDFLMDHGDEIIKMALIGDVRWRDQLFAFVGKGLRRTEIEFFPTSSADEADRWIRA
jgi:hypothetical protein